VNTFSNKCANQMLFLYRASLLINKAHTSIKLQNESNLLYQGENNNNNYLIVHKLRSKTRVLSLLNI